MRPAVGPTATRPTAPDGLVTTVADSPLGPLRLYAVPSGLYGVYFDGHRPVPRVGPADALEATAPFEPVLAQLAEYFAGRRWAFDLDLAPVGTAFQLEVWSALRTIPVGETCSYAELARGVRRPAAVRAVGAANGRNPLSIIVPCHRVVGASGTLTGYAGGLDRKRWLLEHEARRA